jgi:hypothetical protein
VNQGEELIDEINDAVFRLDDLRGDLRNRSRKCKHSKVGWDFRYVQPEKLQKEKCRSAEKISRSID